MNEKKILIVEDEMPIRDMFEQAFSRAGYTVRSADSAEQAMEILEQENIQVMFLDLSLKRMNGLELCQQIRKEKPLAIIHAVTGYISLFEPFELRKYGFDDYFTKPVELDTLFKAASDSFEKIERWETR